MKNNNILSHFARQGSAFLHPNGKDATALLLKQLSESSYTAVLDIGCGTGATLVELSRLKNVTLFGADISDEMIKVARERLNYCKVHAEIYRIDNDGQLPFPSSYFTHITAESLLGIVNESVLQNLLNECIRLLKPGGLLLVNDAIWKKGVCKEEIFLTNSRCLHDFGIIQAQPALVGKKEWEALFTQSGFEVVESLQIAQQLQVFSPQYGSHPLSVTFSRKKKLAAWLNPFFIIHELYMRWNIFKHHRNSRNMLESYLFVLQKPD